MEKKQSNSYISSNLKLALSRKFNIHISEITKDFLKTLTEIDLPGSNIRDIKGIEYATNAIYVNLTRNNIYDASPIEKLKNLEGLELNENKIEDINFLKNLKKLRSVGLESNNIKAIPNLSNLKNLNLINLDNNKILDISNLINSSFESTTILATDQSIILDPIEVEYGKTILFSSNIKWSDKTYVFLDNIQISGKYDRVSTDEKPSFLYSISEVIINNIESDCIVTMDFYHEESSKVFSGTIIQPIYLKKNINEDKKDQNKDFNKDLNFSCIYGSISLSDGLNNNICKDKFENKIITLIYENGKTIYTSTNKSGKYKFDSVPMGKYTLLFPVLTDYVYITDSIHVLNIKNKDKYCINSVVEVIK